MKQQFYIALLLALSWSCANRVSPTGGPKDEDPPQVVNSTPAYGERNFTGQEIALEFNEYVTVKNFKEQLLITPRITGEYKYKIRKRTLYVEFAEPFADSTTYTLNFRDAVVDITEGNPAQELMLAFSTGNLLDTLEIKGIVVDLLTKNPIDGITVALYPEDDTLNIFSGPPYYLTKTNKQGNYAFKNIKDGTYKLYAFNDINKNNTCQSDMEKYGFLPESIILDTAFVADTINLVQLNIDSLKVLRARSSGRYFLLSANKYITEAHLNTATNQSLYYKFDDDHHGLKIYQTLTFKDSLQVYATLSDSLGTVVKDTFYLKFPETNRRPDAFNVTSQEPEASLLNKRLRQEITLNKPVLSINIDSLAIIRDSTEIYYVKEFTSYSYDKLNGKLELNIKIPPAIIDSLKTPVAKGTKNTDKGYSLSIPTSTFISVENDTSQQITRKIKVITPEKTGVLTGAINSLYSSYFIQLLDSKYVVVQEQQGGSTYKFAEVVPGEYFIRILVDENENGKWDLGNILENKLPEKVIIYTDETGNNKTSVRANWEITIDLSF